MASPGGVQVLEMEQDSLLVSVYLNKGNILGYKKGGPATRQQSSETRREEKTSSMSRDVEMYRKHFTAPEPKPYVQGSEGHRVVWMRLNLSVIKVI